jgi:hypothetical protein
MSIVRTWKRPTTRRADCVTNQGDYILDSLSDMIEPWAGYELPLDPAPEPKRGFCLGRAGACRRKRCDRGR